MVLDVLVALDGECKAKHHASILAGFLEIPAAALGIQAMVGSQQKRTVGRGGNRFAQQSVEPREVFLGLVGLGAHMCIG